MDKKLEETRWRLYVEGRILWKENKVPGPGTYGEIEVSPPISRARGNIANGLSWFYMALNPSIGATLRPQFKSVPLTFSRNYVLHRPAQKLCPNPQ